MHVKHPPFRQQLAKFLHPAAPAHLLQINGRRRGGFAGARFDSRALGGSELREVRRIPTVLTRRLAGALPIRGDRIVPPSRTRSASAVRASA
jgi:hypothetical protein